MIEIDTIFSKNVKEVEVNPNVLENLILDGRVKKAQVAFYRNG